MILVWSFTTKMQGYKNADPVLELYKASIIRAKNLGYKVKLYGCKYTLEYLKGYYKEYVDISDEKFILTDDLKIFIHERESLDCVTIDGDIILKSNIPFSQYVQKDVIFEYPETKENALNEARAIYIGYLYLIKLFRKYPIKDTIEEYNDDGGLATNVGIIKFNNQKTKDLFISKYKAFRKYFLEEIEPTEDLVKSEYVPSIVICQFLFGCLVTTHNIDVGYAKKIASYDHYYGVWKYDPDVQKMANNIIEFEKTKTCLI